MATVEGALRTPDGYWLVEVVRAGRCRWYRVTHGTTVVVEQASIATVQRILGNDFPLLQPADVDESAGGTA